MQSGNQQRMSFGKQPVVLIGDPRQLEGLLHAHNPCDIPLKLRRLRLHTSDAALRNGCDEDVLVSVGAAKLCPGETKLLRVKARLPPGTPPGAYQAYLEGADESRVPVAITVLERRRVRLSPAAIVLGCQPGAVVVVRASASNLGNVPALLPKRAAVELHSGDRGWLHHFHAAASAHGQDGYEGFLNAFVRRMGRDEPPPGRAKLLAGHGVLAAQDARQIELEVSLPKGLRDKRKYEAIVRLAGARLRMTLYVTAATSTAPG